MVAGDASGELRATASRSATRQAWASDSKLVGQPTHGKAGYTLLPTFPPLLLPFCRLIRDGTQAF